MNTAPTEPGTRTVPGAESRTGRRTLLRGLPWLVVRQHRAALYSVLALVVLGCALIVHQRGEMIDTLEAAGWPAKDAPTPVVSSQAYTYVTSLLGGLPLLLAVFFGAPLIAADQEQGTVRLVTTQSVTRRRWLIAKLTLCFSVALASGAVLSAVYTWWWEPYRSVFPATWIDGAVFDNTGPMLPAFCLFLTAAGVTTGLLLRRVMPAMLATFVFTTVVTVAWGEFRNSLGTIRTLTFPLNAEAPARPADAHEVDQWVGTADGTLYGWGSCVEQTEAASQACVKEKGIVNNVIEYLDADQMAAMQWTGAGILVAATAVLTAYVVWHVSRRPL